MQRRGGYKKGRFSFNVKGGRCEACAGDGILKIEMHFLPDVYVPCEVCERQSAITGRLLEVKYKGKTIYDVLNMTVEEALEFFDHIPSIRRKMETLNDVGSVLYPSGTALHGTLRRRGAEDQAGIRAEQEKHGQDGLYSGRAHHRTAFCGCAQTDGYSETACPATEIR